MRPTSIRLSAPAAEKLAALTALYGAQTKAIEVAIEALWQREIGRKTVDIITELIRRSTFKRVREVGDAALGYYVLGESWDALSEGQRIAAVVYHTGVVMTPADWQGYQPDMADDEEVAATCWQDENGQFAIVFNGLPVKAP